MTTSIHACKICVMTKSAYTVGISLSTAAIYESGVALFSYLAFPEEDDGARRAGVHAALCNLALRATGNEDEKWLWTPSLMKPAYALMREASIQR